MIQLIPGRPAGNSGRRSSFDRASADDSYRPRFGLAGPAQPASPAVHVPGRAPNVASAIRSDGRIFDGRGGRGPANSAIALIDDGRIHAFFSGLPSARRPRAMFTGPPDVAVVGKLRALASMGVRSAGGSTPTSTPCSGSRRSSCPLGDVQAYLTVTPDLTDIDRPPNPHQLNPYHITTISSPLPGRCCRRRPLFMVGGASRSAPVRGPERVRPNQHLASSFPLQRCRRRAAPTASRHQAVGTRTSPGSPCRRNVSQVDGVDVGARHDL